MASLAHNRASVSAGRPLLDLVLERIRRWRADAARRAAVEATRQELSRLSDRELDDLGISRWDIPRVAREAVYGR